MSRKAVWAVLKRYDHNGTILRMPGSGRRAKAYDARVRSIVEANMQDDDETTAIQLYHQLIKNGITMSITTILRSRLSLGWTFRGSAYCQMIRVVNKTKRLAWAQDCLERSDDFRDVVWTDETSVQLENHKRQCCRKIGQPPKRKPRPKHRVKVHVWGGISWNGRTELIVFDGIMNADLYIQIHQLGLLPFLARVYPDGHRFMQDNEPKHTIANSLKKQKSRQTHQSTTTTALE